MKRLIALFLAALFLIQVNRCGDSGVNPAGIYDPENLTISKISTTSAELSWEYTGPDTVDHEFIVARKSGLESWNLQFAATSATRLYTTFSEADSLLYLYKVQTESTESGDASDFTDIVALFPDSTSPADLTAEVLSVNSLKISWHDRCQGEEGYIVNRKVGDGNWQKKYSTLAADTEYLLDQGSYSDTIIYEIYPFYGDFHAMAKQLTVVSAIPAPIDIHYTIVDLKTIQLNWTDQTGGLYGFNIDKKVDDNNWQSGYGAVAAGTTAWTDSLMEIDAEIEYRVYGVDGEMTSSAISTGSIQNIFPAPYGLTIIKLDEQVLKLTWSDSLELGDSYVIERKVGFGEWESGFAVVRDDLNYVDYIDYQCGTFQYRVRAAFEDQFSAYSNEAAANVRLELIGNISTSQPVKDLDIDANMIYLANYYNGVQIVDCANPTSPAITASVSLSDRTQAICYYEGLIYAVNHTGGLRVIVPETGEIISEYNTAGIANDLFVTGAPPYAYIAEKDSGLSVVSIASSKPVKIAGWKSQTGTAEQITVAGNYLYLANGSGGLVILDISDPYQPSFLAQLTGLGTVLDIFVDDDLAYLACGEAGLKIIDIHDKTNPVLVQSVSFDGYLSQVYLQNDYLFMADRENGLIAASIAASEPVILGNYSIENSINCLKISGSYAYICSDSGFQIIQVLP